MFLEIPKDKEFADNTVFPTSHQREVSSIKLGRIVSDEACTQGVIVPQGIAEHSGCGRFDAGLAPAAGKGCHQLPLLIDVVQQGKPDTIKAFDLIRGKVHFGCLKRLSRKARVRFYAKPCPVNNYTLGAIPSSSNQSSTRCCNRWSWKRNHRSRSWGCLDRTSLKRRKAPRPWIATCKRSCKCLMVLDSFSDNFTTIILHLMVNHF